MSIVSILNIFIYSMTIIICKFSINIRSLHHETSYSTSRCSHYRQRSLSHIVSSVSNTRRSVSHVNMVKMDINFTNKVVLVTGASAGIGEATALLFAKLGASLSLVGRNAENLQKVADRCEKEKGVKPLAIIADLGTDEGVEKTAKETIDHYGKLDVLVNNAAVGARTCIQRADMATFDQVFNIDVRGVYNLTRLLVPHLIETKGNIVNISSISGSMVTVGSLPYGMAKAALDHFTKLIALELGPKGVRVNTVSPGVTESEFVKRLIGISEEEYEAWLKKAASAVPLGEVCVGMDIAKMIVYLASDHSRLVTGVIVQVDGGLQFSSTSNLMADQMK